MSLRLGFVCPLAELIIPSKVFIAINRMHIVLVVVFILHNCTQILITELCWQFLSFPTPPLVVVLSTIRIDSPERLLNTLYSLQFT